MSANWLQFFKGSARSRELQDTYDLFGRASSARSGSPLHPDDRAHDFMLNLIHEVCEKRQITPSVPLGEALWGTLRHLLYIEGFCVELPDGSSIEKLTVEEGVELRSTLRRHLRFLDDQNRLLTIWRDKLVYVFSGMLEYFPLSAFADVDEKGFAADDSIILPDAKAYALCDNLPEVLDRLLITFYDQDITNARLFEALRERFDNNALFASGIPKERRNDAKGRAKLPSENKDQGPQFLVDAYLQATPFYSFFQSPLPFAIPFPARFEHTHIVGGTGHGKTQLMQFLINHDLVRAAADGRSVVVMDSQGDLYRAISRLRYFSPQSGEALADRLVLIDPNDVDYPVALNMFDFNRDRLSGFPRVDQEKILNATIELYEYFFGALLGAELTQRQGLIFKYLARLLMQIPDATIHTLRDLMENAEKYRPYMEELGGTARAFFLTRFFDRQFNETKKQILTRLWGGPSNASLERMFSHRRNKVDMFSLLNEGKIILINTAKDLLGQEGSAIFGRFFIALIAQAAVQRAAIPAHERRPAFVYIDEAQDYFDDNISNLLNQARKYRIGLIFAHQNLDQLGAGLRSSVLASTSIKFAGGVSAKDARVLDSELRCEPEFLMTQKKERAHTEFACHVRNYTGRALSVRIPLGHVDSLPKLTHDDWDYLLEDNRGRYSAPPMLPPLDEPDEPPAPSGKPSNGGARPRPVPVPREEVRARTVEPQTPQPPTEEPQPSTDTTKPTVPATIERKAAPKRQKAAKEIPELGRGGRQHKYIQHLIKQLGEERGFRAIVEESILDGAGSVDVALIRGKDRIAFEISITTRNDQELGNIEKCIAAGYKTLVLVGANEKHLKTLSKFIEDNLEEKDQGKVQYVTPDALVDCLNSFGPPPSEQTVRGYKVRTVQSVIDPEDAAARRKALAEVIARSMKKSKDGE